MKEKQALIDAKKTLEQIKKQNKKIVKWDDEELSFENFAPTYSFSNENLKDYFNFFDIKNGNVLTVTGSGDQVITSILHGAKNIDCFDSNTLSYYNLMLKLNAIKSLDVEDFLTLYNILTPVKNRKKYYLKFNESISQENIKIFWDFIFSKKGDLFRECFINKTDKLDGIDYLDIEKYKSLQNINSNINFKKCDVFELPNKYHKKYDFINLSNIYNFIDNSDDFVDLINILDNKNLKENGKILVTYSWKKPNFYSKINYISKKLNARQIRVNKTSDDSIVVYTKKLNSFTK
ncbi:MAG: DUF3419 family protein [Bacilli bacterium]|nr:DUF3419 family protein [Bacilli bacterium]